MKLQTKIILSLLSGVFVAGGITFVAWMGGYSFERNDSGSFWTAGALSFGTFAGVAVAILIHAYEHKEPK